uniref:RING finger protein 223-like n=1 Tax=Euleptes europaea TaxID=460621 RepID=UPI00254252EF|nr:RING finger protein 223-like [Euleptes europaea]
MDISATPANPTGQEETEASTPECPVCYLAYNNVFNTPLLLPCSHTFCLECLARLCAFLKPNQTFRCPLCRESIPLPQEGVPSLPANVEVIQQFPPWMRELEQVWMEGFRLCWLKKLPGKSKEQDAEMVVTVDLYKAIAQDNLPQNFISTHPSRSVYRGMCRLLLENYSSVICAAAVFFVVVMLPMALFLGLRRD